MRLLPILAAIMLTPTLALADDAAPAKKRVAIPDAASLIGKKLSDDRQSEIGSNTPMTKSDDWSYGFSYDDGGLSRYASTPARGKKDALLSTDHSYDSRCAANEKTAPFSFNADESFKLKGTEEKGRYSDAWVYLGDDDKFDDKPLKIKMDISEMDGAMHFKLEPASLSAHGAAAICPTSAPPGKAGSKCAAFSLKGFARAYDYICNAK